MTYPSFYYDITDEQAYKNLLKQLYKEGYEFLGNPDETMYGNVLYAVDNGVLFRSNSNLKTLVKPLEGL